MTHDSRFFEKHSKRVRRTFIRSVWIRNVLLFFGIVLIGWFIVVLVVFAQMMSVSKDASQALEHAKQEAEILHFESAIKSLDSSQRSFAFAMRTFPILKTVHWVPFLGSFIVSSEEVIVAGDDVTKSLSSVMQVGTDVLKLSGLSEQYFAEVKSGISPRVSFSDLPGETKRVVLDRLKTAADKFVLLSKRLALVGSELERVSLLKNTWPFSKLIDPVQQSLIDAQNSLDRVSRFAYLLPVFAGTENPQSFLFLFLNNTELRPGGGFIGNYGILTLQNGDVKSFKTTDVYTLDRLVENKVKEPSPYPLQKYNLTPTWFLRDSNWSPDFSVSSQSIMRKYLEEVSFLSESEKTTIPYSKELKGVIAITPMFAQEILKIIGPITVAGQTFTSDNIADKLEYQVEFGYAKQGIPESQRKEIIATLMDQCLQKLSQLPLKDWSLVISAMEKAFQEKQFLVYHTDPSVEQVISSVGWGGRMITTTSDVQGVVDANLASLKSDPSVHRTIKYELFQNTNNDWIGRTTVHYQHTGTFDWKTTTYRTYTRLYTPLGTKLVRILGSVESTDTSEELGMSVFGSFFTVNPGTSKDLVFEYVLPEQIQSAISNGKYTLTYFKQPGAQNNPLTLHLDFGKNVLHATPPEAKGAWGDSVYQVEISLDRDQKFEVKL